VVVVNDVAGAGTGDSVTNLTTSTTYDALSRPTDVYDPAGTRTRYDYDRLARTVATTANYVNGTSSGPTGADDVRSAYAYDAVGGLVGYCPAVGVVAGCVATSGSDTRAWHYGLDALGRTTSQVAPDNVSATDLDATVWTYEGGGRLGSVIDQTDSGTIGRHTDLTYDKLGRTLTSRVYLGAGTSGNLRQTTTRTHTIDGDPASVAFDGTGDGLGVPQTYSFTYDALGRPDLVKKGSTTMTDLAYSADGTVSQRIDTNPVSTGTTYTTTFGYDWAKRPASVASPSVFSGSATTTYRLDGLLATRSTPNGETLTLAYDAARRPVTATLAAGNTISQTYDRLGNVTTEGRSFSGISGDPGSGTNTFSYDPLRRLTAETGLSSSRSYQYDLDGNRTRKVEGATTIDYTYDRTDQLINQVIAGLGTAFSYDPYGNLTQAGNSVSAVTSYTYSTASHLTTINAPGTTQDVAFALDALGRFATRTVNGGTDTYGYLGSSETVTTIVGATSTRVSALGADGSRVATKDGSTTGYLLPDLHGNVVAAEASASTTISNALRYDGYGQTLGAYTGSGPIAMDAKYQGRLDLSATTDPLYDMAARFYAPGSGTFTQLDSVLGSAQNPLSMNRFLYAEANPTTFIDPTGHFVPADDGLCRYRGDPGCGETANCSTCKVQPPTTPKPKPEDNDDSTAGGAIPPVAPYQWGGPDDRPYGIDAEIAGAELSDYLSFMNLWCGGWSIFPRPECDGFVSSSGVMKSLLIQGLPVLGDTYQGLVVLGGYDPIAGVDLTEREQADSAVTMLGTAGLAPAFGAGHMRAMDDYDWIPGAAVRSADDIERLLSRLTPAMVERMNQRQLTGVVAMVAQREANRGLAAIDSDLTRPQKLAVATRENAWRVWQYRGSIVHDRTRQTLENLVGKDNVEYFHVGEDFKFFGNDNLKVELTTFGQLKNHTENYPSLPEYAFALYKFPSE